MAASADWGSHGDVLATTNLNNPTYVLKCPVCVYSLSCQCERAYWFRLFKQGVRFNVCMYSKSMRIKFRMKSLVQVVSLQTYRMKKIPLLYKYGLPTFIYCEMFWFFAYNKIVFCFPCLFKYIYVLNIFYIMALNTIFFYCTSIFAIRNYYDLFIETIIYVMLFILT